MIIWINGPFGSGKTQTAFALSRRLPGSFVYDPETVGFWLRQNQPAVLRRDNFQDEPLWRAINRDMLKSLACRYPGVILVPMTLANPQYYQEIITELRKAGERVIHILLLPSPAVVRRRLRKRLEFGNSWAARQLAGCMAAFQDPVFENPVCTDGCTVEEAAELAAKIAGVTLLPRRSRPRQFLDRFFTQLRALR